LPHIHELYDFTIAVFIVYEDQVLLVNHPRYDKWIPMGGHIELDEDPEQALFREIDEETGLEVTILSSKPDVKSAGTKTMLTPNYMDVHEANPPHRHVGLIYFARAHSDKARLSDEHTELKWFTREELHEKKYGLPPIIIFYAEEALKLNGAG
jgi:8-oxo-dGTP pyrophosphatase MutT (NUDIX family)